MNPTTLNDHPIPMNTVDSQSSTLLPEIESAAQVLASDPRNVELVERIAHDTSDVEHRGGLTVANLELQSARRRWQETEAHGLEAQTRLWHTEPKIIIPGRRADLGFAGYFALFGLLTLLLGMLWAENTAAAQTLYSTGAFNVETLWAARLIMATPMVVGLVASAAVKVLPHVLRRRVILGACVVLVVGFGVWTASFADQAQRYFEDSAETLSLSFEESSTESNDDLAPGHGWTAWLMLACLTSNLGLTSFIGHCTLDRFLSQYETWVNNPDYTRAKEEVRHYQAALKPIDAEIAAAAGKVAEFSSKVNLQQTLAQSAFTSAQNAASKLPILLIGVAMLSGCQNGAAGDESSRGPNRTDPSAPIKRVIAISPHLSTEGKAVARARLEEGLAWLISKAPTGSEVVVADALECIPVARLKAVPGVSRIRKNALARHLPAIREFLNRPPTATKDGRVHLPHLTQAAKQWGLPNGSHIVVLGSPLFLDDGNDALYSMADGRVPSDGCLFADPKLNLYSVVGRENALSGQYWHLAWLDSKAFDDDTHRQAVLRFWSVYLQAQSALLVTAQPSFEVAMGAARRGTTVPLMHAEADKSTRPAMEKVIKVRREKTSSVAPPAENQVNGDLPLQVVEAAVTEKRRQHEAEFSDRKIEADTSTRDQYGNLKGSENDLVVDGQMAGQKILLATFYMDKEVESSPLIKALTEKGFALERIKHPLPRLREFELMLDRSQELWIWSSGETSQLPPTHLRSIVTRWRRGKLALCLLADNSPYTTEAAQVLAAISPGSTISGNYRGTQTLHARSVDGTGFDEQSPLFHNITALYEGITISTVSGRGLVPVCYASDGSPLIATLQARGSSRLLVHCGFTSLFERYWDDAGIRRFAVNCAGWLGGADAQFAGRSK